jgi:hypothetical protein
MKCSNCNRDSDHLTLFVNPETGDSSQICIACSVARAPEIMDLNEAEEQIQQFKNLIADIQNLMAETRYVPTSELSPDLSPFAMTPEKVLSALTLYLENAEKDRKNIQDAQALR